jgi:hypothetical protein
MKGLIVMPITDVTYRFEFGTAIDEAGLNAISAGLRVSQPGLFTHSDTVVVKPAPAGQPPSAAHLLTIYAVVKKPLAFNLYPVSGLPNLPADSMMIQADIEFSLTDSILGLITRIEVVAQATANIQYSADTATIELLSFELIDIEADPPPPPAPTNMSSRANVATASAKAVVPIAPLFLARMTDDPLGDAFRAIIKYLVELYLKDTLETAISSFPVPSLDKIIHFGGLGTLPISGVFIRNKAFYLMAGNDLGAPAIFPSAPARAADIRIGVSQTGLRRVINAFLPLPVPVDVGHDYNVLHLTGNLSIPNLDVSLPPGSSGIPVQVNIGGLLNLHVSVPIPIFGGTLQFDVPIPIDYLTQYIGQLFPTLVVEQYPANPNATIQIGLAPDVSFLGAWVAFVVTDYRDYLAQQFQQAANNAVNQLVGNQFCNWPIVGWIVCGTIDVTADVIGYLLGAVLDFWASTILTGLVDVIGRILFLFMQGPQFNVLTFKQSDLYQAIGVSLQSALLEIVANGRDGDLQLSTWIQDQGLPIPPVPAPVTPLPPPQPAPIPPYPGVPTLPVYGQGDFVPALTLPVPTWVDGVNQSYSLGVTSAQHPIENATYFAQFQIQKLSTGWRLSLTTHDADGTVRAECRADYDAQSIGPLTLQRVSYGQARTRSVTMRQSVDLTNPGQAAGSFGVDGTPSAQLITPTIQGVSLEFEDFWPFRFAHSALSTLSGSKCGTIAITDPHTASNWVREIPLTVAIAEGFLAWAPSGGIQTNVPVWIVSASEESKQTVAKIAKDGRGLLQETITTSEVQIVMTRQ